MKKELTIIKKIEQSRKELIDLASQSSLSSPEVIEASITLDKILNNYEEHKKQ
jgi:hypothetical protein